MTVALYGAGALLAFLAIGALAVASGQVYLGAVRLRIRRRREAMKKAKRAVRFAVVIGTSLTTVLCASSASAQEFLKDRRFQQGIGIRAGDVELHPGFAIEGGYDSNYFLRSWKRGDAIVNGAPRLPPTGAVLTRVTPSFRVATLGPQRREDGSMAAPPAVRFDAGLAATWREFFGNDLVQSQRAVGGSADMRLEILPEQAWGAAFYGNYARTVNPNVYGNPDLAFTRNDVGGGGEIAMAPGGGTLDWRIGYGARATLFETAQGNPFNNLSHEGYTRGRWLFRPQTAFLADVSVRSSGYLNPQPNSVLRDSSPVRARMGLKGLVTSRFVLTAIAGYGASFSQSAPPVPSQQFDSVIGQGELKFLLQAPPMELTLDQASFFSGVSLGYTRDFQNSYLGSYYGQDRGYAKFDYLFGGRFLVAVDGGASAIRYPTFYYATGQVQHAPATDLRVDGGLFIEYRFADSLGVNLSGRYSTNISHLQLTEVPGQALVYDFNWRRIEAFGGVRWFM